VSGGSKKDESFRLVAIYRRMTREYKVRRKLHMRVRAWGAL
jgi:hypothetical protein